MADNDAGERTETASPRRRVEARERGQVARSADLSAAVTLLAGLYLLQSWGPDLMIRLMDLQARWFARLAAPHLDAQAAGELFLQSGIALGLSVAPVALGLLAVGLTANLVQVGAVFTGVPLEPQWERINPIAGFGRLFSIAASVRLLMNLLKLGAIGWVAYATVVEHLPMLEGLLGRPVGAIFSMASQVIFLMGVRIACLLLILGILDYGYQHWDHERGLRMTKQEVKEELKRMEGDPQIKSRRLQMARQLARQRMLKKVPEADVVITNPTELAIAIQFDATTMAAPKVVAKGARLVAERIRAIAAEHGVPIVERKPLARALYKAVEVGDYVPEEYWQTVIEVLKFVLELDRGRGTRWGIAPARAGA